MKNRWLIAASAIGIHLSIGSIYAYSVMTNPVKDIFSTDAAAIKWAFKLAILFLGLTTTFLGKWVEEQGPKKSGIAAGLFYGTGILGAGLGVHLQSLPLFYLSYGVLGGIGLGIGYMAPISTLVKWFPDRKGLATGLAIMGFGFSALLFGPLMQGLFEQVGVAKAFFILGLLYASVIILSSLYLSYPPADYLPKGFHPEKVISAQVNTDSINSPDAALKTHRFWFLWTLMFINIASGIALISAASPLMQEALHFSPLKAAAMVGIIGVFNGLGRIFWSSLSDYTGRLPTFIFFFLFQSLAFYLLPNTGADWTFLLLLFVIVSMYGGGFAILPAFVSDLFGVKHMGVINGRVLSSWALAGIAGPTLYDIVKAETGSIQTTLGVFSVMLMAALGIALLMWFKVRKTRGDKVKHLFSPKLENVG
ncbi:MFS transporter [Robertkochia marina]|uniref:MFS transporter n=1 Tax=Robertkochia marina TaxID=1227945 RepID=A0A4S3M5J0_9FLAO|nr:MFS transporter [Robertkochia marina]TRZ47678.1 MFS transporter [Robertkochia marina]